MLVSTSEREKTKKYEKLWIKIRDLVRAITKNSDDYEENINLIQMMNYL